MTAMTDREFRAALAEIAEDMDTDTDEPYDPSDEPGYFRDDWENDR
jgi:hypothetical protein